jgi:hypothetical protein
MLISDTVWSIWIHRLSWINWLNCSLRSISFSVDRHPECLLPVLVHPFCISQPLSERLSGLCSYSGTNTFVHFSSYYTHWSQNSNDKSMFSLAQSANEAALLNIQIPLGNTIVQSATWERGKIQAVSIHQAIHCCHYYIYKKPSTLTFSFTSC